MDAELGVRLESHRQPAVAEDPEKRFESDPEAGLAPEKKLTPSLAMPA